MSRKLREKRDQLLNDPNWNEPYPRKINENQHDLGMSKFCQCGRYHPIWFFEKPRYVLDKHQWGEYQVCPENGTTYVTAFLLETNQPLFSCIEFIEVQ